MASESFGNPSLGFLNLGLGICSSFLQLPVYVHQERGQAFTLSAEGVTMVMELHQPCSRESIS